VGWQRTGNGGATLVETISQELRRRPPYYDHVFNGKDVTQKARCSRSRTSVHRGGAQESDTARSSASRLAFNGQVTNIQAITALPYGLQKKRSGCAADEILPATKDSHAVSMYMQVEYNFNLY